jgi:hypothetical protein
LKTLLEGFFDACYAGIRPYALAGRYMHQHTALPGKISSGREDFIPMKLNVVFVNQGG